MTILYELAVLGAPAKDILNELESCISEAISPFGLHLGVEIAWIVDSTKFNPTEIISAAAVFFGAAGLPVTNVQNLLRRGIPILPIASHESKVSEEIPSELRHLNCLFYKATSVKRIATALLECAGLLPRQRRVFLSYRRTEARQAALQLFDAFSSRQFDVFLDTHDIAPAEDFQAMLWHRLCDSDVLVMLDTPNYFNSRWTSAEFGRALAKGISVLRIGWADTPPSVRTATASHINLKHLDVDSETGLLTEVAISRICQQLETVRSQSHAIRYLSLISNIRIAVEQIGGQITGIGLNKSVYVSLPNNGSVVVYPTIGVPTSMTLHDAFTNACGRQVAVVYDSIGLHQNWLNHLAWLGVHVKSARWVKACEAAWQFGAWE